MYSSGFAPSSIIHIIVRRYITFAGRLGGCCCGRVERPPPVARHNIIQRCRCAREPVGRVLRVSPNGLTVSDGSGAHRTWLHTLYNINIVCRIIIYVLHVREHANAIVPDLGVAGHILIYRPAAVVDNIRYYNVVQAQIYLYNMRMDLIASGIVCAIRIYYILWYRYVMYNCDAWWRDARGDGDDDLHSNIHRYTVIYYISRHYRASDNLETRLYLAERYYWLCSNKMLSKYSFFLFE